MHIIYTAVFKTPYNSFPVALLFIVYGKILAEKSVSIPRPLLSILIISSLFLLYVEYYLIWHFSIVEYDDCFIFLIPLSLFCFMYIGQSKWTLNMDTKKMRAASTVIYCCHASYSPIVNFILEQCKIEPQVLYILLFLITLLLSVLTFVVIDKLEQKPHFGILKYAH